MSARFLVCLAVVVGLAAPAPVRSAEKEPKPIVTFQVQSLEKLLEAALYLTATTGNEEPAKQMDAFLKARIGDKGFEGIDVKKPLGGYVFLGAQAKDNPNFVFFVPLADEKTFLEALDNLDFLKVKKKGEDGVRTVQVRPGLPLPLPPFDLHMTFANQYAYLSLNDKAPLAKDKRLDPAEVLPAVQTNLATVVWHLDRLPEELKQNMLKELKAGVFKNDIQGIPKDSPQERAMAEQCDKAASQLLAAAVEEGRRVELRLDLDLKTEEVSAELAWSGQAGSKLATKIANLGENKSSFAGLPTAGMAMDFQFCLPLSEELRKQFGDWLEEGVLKNLKNGKDDADRETMTKFVKFLKPKIMQADSLNSGVRLFGPTKEGRFFLLANHKIENGAAMEKELRALVKDLSEQKRAAFHFDTDKIGNVNIHRMDNPQKDAPAEKEGKEMDVNPAYWAITPTEVWLATGSEGVNALKKALEAKPAPMPLFRFQASMARMSLLPSQGKKENPAAAKIAKEFIDKGEDDRMIFTVEGGKELKARFAVKAAAIRFFAKVKRAEEEMMQEP